jgi:hypothetical protein
VKRINIYQDIGQLFQYLEAVETEKTILQLARSDLEAVASIADDIQIKLLVFITTSTDDTKQL